MPTCSASAPISSKTPPLLNNKDMISESLEAITGVSIYPIISFVLFFTFFAGMLVWVFRQSKAEIAELSNLPLDDDQTSNL